MSAPDLDDLRQLAGRVLPGGSLRIAPYEVAIADDALESPHREGGRPHPIWLVIASLRGLGITVDELCELARKSPQDTLLIGDVEISHRAPLSSGTEYLTTARIGAVDRRETRDGGVLDTLVVIVDVLDDTRATMGQVTSTYLVKRAVA
ncbi:unannotated protein [freshwater metagenome]|uniref:Unannotated protein n=1 Tax=freshwater metagenome TaxID=449393 RepID=A0A6J7REA0_9ZZZZ|nr:hypothetical protein [Actinomycetota bacterium]MSW36196.1 hypothetical protein [Actinomycetota bacterium]MSX37890.1 hypothetical protein [Actinomycetota bacterium]